MIPNSLQVGEVKTEKGKFPDKRLMARRRRFGEPFGARHGKMTGFKDDCANSAGIGSSDAGFECLPWRPDGFTRKIAGRFCWRFRQCRTVRQLP
ncbi:hypothetical protein A1355_14925 [Methylomonas koyamae]|uniref:Uncharacterized protein n=1 Tax=Methylomonas koyamae TaxID=702114 RepID=A0A177N231_9GAMM|nr:hypothetical protein A1355_14925 [Methylomonas koyamae]